MNTILLLFSIALWGTVHSLLASMGAKAAFLRALGPGPMRFYRLGYNLFSALSFLPIVWLRLTLPDRPLYQVPASWSYLMMAGQAAGLVLLILGVLQTGPLAFVGLRQLFEEEREGALVTRGLYRLVRHPLYSAGLLILWLTPVVSLNTFIIYLGLTAYLLAGAWFEERKLLREFGKAYEEYRKVTPMLIPGLKPGKQV